MRLVPCPVQLWAPLRGSRSMFLTWSPQTTGQAMSASTPGCTSRAPAHFTLTSAPQGRWYPHFQGGKLRLREGK